MPRLLIAPLLFVAASLLEAGPVAAQAQAVPQRDGLARAQDVTGTASISGTVTVAGSGHPARKARVSISAAELRGGRTTATDELGRFVFAGLPAGRFSVRVSKPGHANVSYGQRRPDSPGTPIQIGEGQKVDIQLQLPRGGVITGTIQDEQGEAIPGTQVRVLRHTTQGGQPTMQQAGSDSTDDRGVYRIYGLQPGDYVVAATPRNSTSFAPAAALQALEVAGAMDRAEALAERVEALQTKVGRIAPELESRLPTDESVEGYAPVYYPGTTAPGSAARVTVGAGEEKMGIDFSLQLVPIARVEGVVVSSTGEAARNIQVSLVNLGEALPSIGGGSSRPDADGRFRIPNVAPGRYLLVARATMGAPGRGGRGGGAIAQLPGRGGRAALADTGRLWASTEVSVDGRNVSDLVLTLQPGITLSGRLVFEGTTPMPSDLSRVRVAASPADTIGPARGIALSAAGVADANGRFTITSVVPGRYRITATGGLQGWTLASSVISGQDTLDFPIEVKAEPIGGAILTFRDRQSELTGTIVDERGQPAPAYTVIVYPAEREFWTPGSRRISSQRPGTDGRFTFRNLPPGEYRLAPVLDPDPGAWYDPAFLEQLENTALRVPLGAGEQKGQNLRIR
jgi:protocatechuate 3,4-dioxygenase beta subunit